MKLVDALVEALAALDVRYVFGVSGANIEHLHDAIHRLGQGKVRSILAKGEDGAAFMADGYARATRKLGVCCSTSGGGMMNLIAGIAESHQSSVPVLALVGQPPSTLDGRGAFQDSSGLGRTVDAEQMFAAVSKFTRRITRPDDLWETLEEAVVAAMRGRPGPAVLLLARSIYHLDVEPMPDWFLDNVAARVKPAPPSPEDLDTILSELRAAKRPVLIVGQGAMRTRAPHTLLEFASDLDIPVATTMAARGEFPNDHPNYLGVLGVAGHPSAHRFLRDEADLLFLAGASLNTMTRAPFAKDPLDLPQKRIVAVSADLGELQRVIEPKLSATQERSWWPKIVSSLAVGLEADIGATFHALHDVWKKAPFRAPALGKYEPLAFAPVLMDIPVLPEHVAQHARASLRQSEAIDCIASHLPTEGTIIYDAGNCAAAALHLLPVPPGVTTLIALGMGGMGYAIAAATGVQLGSPEGTRSVVVAGDGSFLMLGMEVHTAAEHKLPILFIVFNNAMHGMCVTRQNVFFEKRFEAVAYPRVDIMQVARGLAPESALWVAKATNRDELNAALKEFDASSVRTGVLELCIDVEEIPPFVPFLPADSPTVPRPLSTRGIARSDR